MASTSTTLTEYRLPIELYDGIRIDVSSSVISPTWSKQSPPPCHTRKPAIPISYAEFFRLAGRHKFPVFSGLFNTLTHVQGPLGKGGSYETRWAEVQDDLTVEERIWKTNPFVLKCRLATSPHLRPMGASFVKAGTILVSKHVNVDSSNAHDPSSFLPTLMKEALVLSHHTIQRSLFFPSFFGFSYEESATQHTHQYPVMLLEMGDGGNLEEWFRGMWRAVLPSPHGRLGGVGGWLNSSCHPEFKLVFDWRRKMRMATFIASAIATLHEAGVVHGDVKFANIICCPIGTSSQRPHPEQYPQLCDFGSCILLSELASNSARLISHTPPWNAPESLSELTQTGLIKTDVYSFGILLARILLDGNDPFAEKYHVLSGSIPEYNWIQIQELQQEDMVAEHVIDQILMPSDLPLMVEDGVKADKFLRPVIRGDSSGCDGCAYTSAQRLLIRNMIRATLSCSPEKRLGNMRLMVKFLIQAITTSEDDLDRLSKFDWSAEAQVREQGEVDEAMTWIQRDSRIVKHAETRPQIWRPPFTECPPTTDVIDLVTPSFAPVAREHFEDQTILRYSDEAKGVPNLLDPTFRAMLIDEIFTKDLLDDLKLQADAGSAPAALQVSWCYLHGWGGGGRDWSQFLRYFKQAALGQSTSALESLHPLQTSLQQPLLNEEEMQLLSSEAVKALGKAVRRHLDLPAVAFLETSFPSSFSTLIAEMKTSTILDAQFFLSPGSEKDPQNQLLQEACRIGDLTAVESLVQEMNETIPTDRLLLELSAALIQASAHGHAFLAIFLLQEGATPCAIDNLSRTPLHFLARFDDDMVDNIGCVLIDYGASVHARDEGGMSPLAYVLDHEKNYLPSSVHIAAQFLINNGAATEYQNLSLAFCKAILSGDTRLMMLFEDLVYMPLQQSEAQIMGFTKEQGEERSQVLFNAFMEMIAEPEMLRRYRFACWRVHDLQIDTARRITFREMIHRLVRHIIPHMWVLSVARHRALDVVRTFENIPYWPQDLLAPVLRCGFVGDLDLAREFLRLGTRFDCVSSPGEKNILHIASMTGWSVDILQTLCSEQQSKVDLIAMANQKATDIHMTPFDQAVLSEHYEMAEFLQNLGADIRSAHLLMAGHWDHPAHGREADSLFPIDCGGRCTLLFLALFLQDIRVMRVQARIKIVKFLLKLGFEALVFPDVNLTVFHAVWNWWGLLASKRKIQPESQDPSKDVNIMFDVLWDHFSDRELLEEAESRAGNTPLIYASISGNVEGVRRLLQHGVNVNKPNALGETAMHMVIDRLTFILRVDSLFETGSIRPPAGEAVVEDMEAYPLLEVLQLLKSHGGVTDVAQGPVDLHHCDHTADTHGCMTDFSMVIDYSGWNQKLLAYRVSEYTLMHFLPPPSRADLGSFRIAIMPSQWYRRHVLIHPEHARPGVVRGFYRRAQHFLVHGNESQDLAECLETEALAGPSGTSNESSDSLPRLLKGMTVRDEFNGVTTIFHRSTPDSYTETSDRNTPYLEFEVPQCKRVNRIVFHFRSGERRASKNVAREKDSEESQTWFEVGIQTRKGSKAPRHFIRRNADGQGQVEGHTVEWDIETVPSELREWLLELETGIVVGVFPRAVGEGVANDVEGMTVECFLQD